MTTRTRTFQALAIIANVSAALVYLGCAAAAWKLRRAATAVGNEDGFRAPGGGVVPVLAALAILFLLATVTLREWSVLATVVVAASALFVVARGRIPATP